LKPFIRQVAFSEPLSFLQRLTEDLEYSDLLDAVASDTQVDRCLQLCHVAAFMVSAYAGTGERIYRPFNPLLGETYECDRTSDLGWRSFAEKVLVPRFVCHARGRGFGRW
jgi:oxysterol-binding protein 1